MIAIPLEQICEYRNESADCHSIQSGRYITTESMLPYRGGIRRVTSIPAVGKIKMFRKGDTLISNIRPYFKKIWKAEFDGTCSNNVLVFRSKNCSPDFLYWLLSSDDFFSYVTKTSKGTKMPRGDKKAIMRYEVCLPDLNTQEAICLLLNSLQSKISCNIKQNDYLA